VTHLPTVVFGGSNRDQVAVIILEAARALLNAQPGVRSHGVFPFDALWTRADRGFYAVKMIDCRCEPTDWVAWAVQEASDPMLYASGWEARLKATGDPELILVLLLDDHCDPIMTKVGFETEIEGMVRPTRTRVWVTTEGFVATADPESPADVFLIHDAQGAT
jgi:hypothetical protein